ncbi:MAG TPA: tetratricopeptide repeat protein [Xanthobacteraceae bacterium]|nr:tetratricopeptide repeat protein [Xanthobacteraceae bacterium]
MAKRLAVLCVLTGVLAAAATAQTVRAASDCDTYAASEFDRERKAPGVPLANIDPGLAIPACESAVRQFPQDSRLIFQLGRAYQKADNFAAAVNEYRKAADQGFALAQNNLGFMYQSGLGVPKDPEQAVTWYRKAAEQGLHNAQLALAGMYLDGQGVPKDLGQAAAWCRKAADQGLAQAQNALGWMYKDGVGVPKDLEQAAAWFGKAADQGLATAQNNLKQLSRAGLSAAQ